ncbi:hypothetical protein KBD71_00640 [Candidatus Woesebacteria bacterium]|nr:hypothetical protein [Candidatus Woesebacteria bacterium]
MTTEFLKQTLGSDIPPKLVKRLEKVRAAWPEVRDIPDTELIKALVAASAIVTPAMTESRAKANGQSIVNQIHRSGYTRAGYDVTSFFLAAATDEELNKITLIAGLRIDVINRALTTMRVRK